MKNNIVFKAAILLAAMAVQNVEAQATVPIDCSSVGYIVTNYEGGDTNFYKFDPTHPDDTTTDPNKFMFKISSLQLNGLGYNPQDGYFYGFIANGSTGFLKIDANGNFTPLTAAGTPIDVRGGTIDKNGIYYLITAGSTLYYIDLKSATPTINSIPATGFSGNTIGDIVWNPANGNLYGVEQNTGALNIIALTYAGDEAGTPTGATVTRPGLPYNENGNLGLFGGVFLSFTGADTTGVLYAWDNDNGEFYAYNTDTGARTGASITTDLSGPFSNDAISCPSLWSDIRVTKSDNVTAVTLAQPTTYQIQVTNNGPSDAAGIAVTDQLPADISAAANVTVTADAGATADLATGEGTQTGEQPLGTVTLLPVGKSVTYNVTVDIPANYGSILTNIATAKPGNFVYDPDLTNDTATDTDDVSGATPCSSVGDVVTIGNNGNTNNNATAVALGIPNNNTRFYKFDPAHPETTTDNVMFTIPYVINSLGYNPVDGYYYTFQTTDNGADPFTLLRIDAGGNVTQLPTTFGANNINLNNQNGNTGTANANTLYGASFKGGTIDKNGIFYLTPQGNGTSRNNNLYFVDLTSTASPLTINHIQIDSLNGAPVATTGNNTLIAGMADIVWDPTGAANKLYGIESNQNSPNAVGKLNIITLTYDTDKKTPISGALTRPGPQPITLKTTTGVGGLFLDFPDGTLNSEILYAWNNPDGQFYIYDTNTGEVTGPVQTDFGQVSTNDGASCPSLWSDIKVTKTDSNLAVAKGDITTYKIVVTNNGPSDAAGITVTDPLPAGITADDMTYTATADAGVTTDLVPNGSPQTVPQTGALSDNITLLPVGKSVTYSVSVTVPADYPTTKLTNTVMVTPDNTIFDPDLTNDSAYDIDSVDPASYLPVNPNISVKILKQ